MRVVCLDDNIMHVYVLNGDIYWVERGDIYWVNSHQCDTLLLVLSFHGNDTGRRDI